MPSLLDMENIILASSSPRRKRLMLEAGFKFEIIVSDAEEISDKFMIPWDLTVQNAQIKASPIAQNNQEKIVIGADTVVILDGKILGKPKDKKSSKKMLLSLSGRTHEVITGVSLQLLREKGAGVSQLVRAMPNTAIATGQSITCLATKGTNTAFSPSKFMFFGFL